MSPTLADMLERRMAKLIRGATADALAEAWRIAEGVRERGGTVDEIEERIRARFDMAWEQVWDEEIGEVAQ